MEIESENEKFSHPFNLIKENDFYQVYVQNFQEFLVKREECLITYRESLKSIVSQLEKRKKQITVSLDFIEPQFNVNSLNNLIYDFNEIINEHNSYGESLGVKKSEAQRLLRLDEVNEFCKAVNITALQIILQNWKTKKMSLQVFPLSYLWNY